MHFNHNNCLHILLKWLLYSVCQFFFCAPLLIADCVAKTILVPPFALFPLRLLDIFVFIEIKQLKQKNPIGTFTLYYIMIVSLGILRMPNELNKGTHKHTHESMEQKNHHRATLMMLMKMRMMTGIGRDRAERKHKIN